MLQTIGMLQPSSLQTMREERREEEGLVHFFLPFACLVDPQDDVLVILS